MRQVRRLLLFIPNVSTQGPPTSSAVQVSLGNLAAPGGVERDDAPPIVFRPPPSPCKPSEKRDRFQLCRENSSHTRTSPCKPVVDLDLTFNGASNGPWSGLVLLGNNDEFDDVPGTQDFEFDDPFVIYLEAFANPPGVAPTVSITSPAANAVVTTPPALTLTAGVSASSPATVN